MTILYLIRHGQTDHNREGRIQGFTEADLSKLGRQQAERLRPRLDGIEFAAVYSSSLRRASETAAAAVGHRYDIEQRNNLREICLGEWEDRLASELRASHPHEVKLWFEKPSELRIPGAETIDEFRERVFAELEGLRALHPTDNVALFVHGGVICAYLTKLLGMKSDDIWRFKIHNASLTCVAFPDGRPRVELLGDTSHLRSDDASVQIGKPMFG